ncbi:MAG: SRPBCC family protein [Phaeodactylibacter sp.]|nr:SRPBCC family protein [Phaeodactylibacter sp.]MCB9275158.1 SRPBCC family protein [Lewinellaceae bacterium]
MKANIEKVFHVDEPIAKVWGFLTDPARIVPCVPGASLSEQIDEDNFKGEVTLKFGPVKASYNGQVTFQERNADAYHMQLLGKGLDSKGKGSADMLMSGSLVEKDGGTEVACSMEISITGMLAQFGSRLITDVSNTVFGQFVDNFKARLAGEEVDNTLKAGSVVGSVVKGIFGKKEE